MVTIGVTAAIGVGHGLLLGKRLDGRRQIKGRGIDIIECARFDGHDLIHASHLHDDLGWNVEVLELRVDLNEVRDRNLAHFSRVDAL